MVSVLLIDAVAEMKSLSALTFTIIINLMRKLMNIKFEEIKKTTFNLIIILAVIGGLYSFFGLFKSEPAAVGFEMPMEVVSADYAQAFKEPVNLESTYTEPAERIRARIHGGAGGELSIESRLRSTFPDIAGKATTKRLGSSGLFEVAYGSIKFLISQDGNYIISHSYIDLSDVNSRAGASNAIEVELGDYYPKNPSSTAMIEYSTENEEVSEVESDAVNMLPESTGQPLPISDFEWAKSNAIPY